MVCKKCNAQIEDKLQFCPKCGCETGYNAKPADDGKKLGILSIVFSFNIAIIGVILGIIGLVKAVKAKTKISIILNVVGLVISVGFIVFYTIYIINFFNNFTGLVNSLV